MLSKHFICFYVILGNYCSRSVKGFGNCENTRSAAAKLGYTRAVLHAPVKCSSWHSCFFHYLRISTSGETSSHAAMYVSSSPFRLGCCMGSSKKGNAASYLPWYLVLSWMSLMLIRENMQASLKYFKSGLSSPWPSNLLRKYAIPVAHKRLHKSVACCSVIALPHFHPQCWHKFLTPDQACNARNHNVDKPNSSWVGGLAFRLRCQSQWHWLDWNGNRWNGTRRSKYCHPVCYQEMLSWRRLYKINKTYILYFLSKEQCIKIGKHSTVYN